MSRHSLAFVSIILAAVAGGENRVPASEPKEGKTASSPLQATAKELPDAKLFLKQAQAEAKSQGKKVLLLIGSPSCRPCRLLEEFFTENEALFDDAYLIRKLDITKKKNGETEAVRLVGSLPLTFPWMAVLDAEGNKLASSDSENGNIALPTQPADFEHFVTMIRKTSSLPPERYTKIAQALEKYAARHRRNASVSPQGTDAQQRTKRTAKSEQDGLPEPRVLLKRYETSLQPYQRMQASWTCEKVVAQRKLANPPSLAPKSPPFEKVTIYRDGDRARLLIENRAADDQPLQRYSEHILCKDKNWMSVFASGAVLSAFKTQDTDFPTQLSFLPTAPCYGYIHIVSIPDFLRKAKLSVEMDLLERNEVFVLRGETEEQSIALWLDPELNYAARRIQFDQLSPKASVQFDAEDFQKRGDVFVPQAGTLKKRLGPNPLLQHGIEFTDVDGKRVSRAKYTHVKDENGKTVMVPVRHEFCEWKLVDIDLAPKFAETDFKLSQPIAEETRISMQDDLLSYYIWKDGKIELLAPYREPAAKASGASGKGQ